jgi:hypothetical protein
MIIDKCNCIVGFEFDDGVIKDPPQVILRALLARLVEVFMKWNIEK